jgi:catechol 2,3-dioxygenase-like lactoylglutathione lyase family enzyme
MVSTDLVPKRGESPRIFWNPEQIAHYERELQRRPHFSKLNHISLAVKDIDEARKFYIDVLGGRLVYDMPHFIEVNVAGTVIGMSATRGRPQASDAEYPHVGFEIESDQFLPMKALLNECGVKTHEIWTRLNIEGLMYFKDPSGNLLEIFCVKYEGEKQRTKPLSADEVSRLDYTWSGKVPS